MAVNVLIIKTTQTNKHNLIDTTSYTEPNSKHNRVQQYNIIVNTIPTYIHTYIDILQSSRYNQAQTSFVLFIMLFQLGLLFPTNDFPVKICACVDEGLCPLATQSNLELEKVHRIQSHLKLIICIVRLPRYKLFDEVICQF